MLIASMYTGRYLLLPKKRAAEQDEMGQQYNLNL